MAIEDWSITAIREQWFARSIVRRLLRAHEAVDQQQPGLDRRERYGAVLHRSGLVEPARIDEFLDLAEDSVDEWTAPHRTGLGLRELAHFVIMVEHRARGRVGAIASFAAIVAALIPAEL